MDKLAEQKNPTDAALLHHEAEGNATAAQMLVVRALYNVGIKPVSLMLSPSNCLTFKDYGTDVPGVLIEPNGTTVTSAEHDQFTAEGKYATELP